MLHDFWRFAQAIWKHWLVLVGGAGLAFLQFGLLARGINIPPFAAQITLAATLFVACFLTWRTNVTRG
jgi:hypothetical protein